MSWQIEIPIIVRTLINDWADQPVYSDDRTTQVITVAAQYVQFDVVLDHKYSVFKAFENNIDPKIVGHWKNLEIKTILENHTKYTKCSIELNELLFLIKESEEK